MEDEKPVEQDRQRAEVFDALGHPTRILILKVLSEGAIGFADLKKKTGIDSSGHLQHHLTCLLYTSPSPRDGLLSRMPSSA